MFTCVCVYVFIGLPPQLNLHDLESRKNIYIIYMYVFIIVHTMPNMVFCTNDI